MKTYETSQGWREMNGKVTPLGRAQMDEKSRKLLEDFEESIGDQFDLFKRSIIGQLRTAETLAYSNGREAERAEWERGHGK